ncbi:MAG TPA: hypothetical protein PKA88_22350 [Polyangiaceae bacterium]|nr:hypothetical protein [Polyangiaceae bacterium]
MTVEAAEAGVADAQLQSDSEGPASVGSGQEYEFKQPENLVIGACAHRARIFGILCAISGFVHVVAVVLSLTGLIDASGIVYLLPTAVFNIVLGILLFRASTALTRVVTTTGSDVSLMMSALTNLSKAFVVQIVLTALVLVAIVGSMVALVVAARMG